MPVMYAAMKQDTATWWIFDDVGGLPAARVMSVKFVCVFLLDVREVWTSFFV